jgi:predicted hotdog family 3-hydroxylacyl-ACP dehydratase
MSLRFQRILLGAAVLVVGVLIALVAVKGPDFGTAGSAVIQGLGVAISIYGGVVFARQGNEMAVRAAAVKSVRRVLVNYESLSRLATIILRLRMDLSDRTENGAIRIDTVDLCLLQLSDVVVDQIASADLAVRDWQDLAPDEVAAEVEDFRTRRQEAGGA